jgi:hypothetical protein
MVPIELYTCSNSKTKKKKKKKKKKKSRALCIYILRDNAGSACISQISNLLLFWPKIVLNATALFRV